MEEHANVRHPVAKAALVAVLAMVIVPLLSGVIFGSLGLPSISPYTVASVSLFIPIVMGAIWFRLNVNRAMAHKERLLFAASVALVNAVLVIAGPYALFGAPPQMSATIKFMEVSLLVFAGTYLLSWLLTSRSTGFSLDKRRPE